LGREKTLVVQTLIVTFPLVKEPRRKPVWIASANGLIGNQLVQTAPGFAPRWRIPFGKVRIRAQDSDMSAVEVISKIKKLPLAEQKKVFRLVEKLRAAQVKKAWDKEIVRRVEEIDSGKVKTIPAEEVFAKLRAKYG